MAEVRWYISFHGGDGPQARNNIHAYTADGRELGPVLDHRELPRRVELRELRGFNFGPDGDLYVANAHRGASRILRFAGQPDATGRHTFGAVFVEGHAANPGLVHPFDAAFGPDGHLYVPNQDTCLVARFYGPRALTGAPGAPMPHPPALGALASGALPPGTFVPSARHAPHGLRAVRHAVFGPDGRLYVADRDANRVRIYDGASGEHLRDLTGKHLAEPVHLVFGPGGDDLYVASEGTDAVLRCDVATGRCEIFVGPRSGGLAAPAGLALGDDGYLYVASRAGKQVLRYALADGKADKRPFIAELPDHPEFVRPVGAVGHAGFA